MSDPPDTSESVRLAPWIVFLVTLVVYYFSNNGQPMNFNYYTRLAQSFWHGRWWLDNLPPWLNEVAQVDGRSYVRFGPMPALVLMPVVALFGEHTNEARVSLTLGAAAVALMWVVLGKVVEAASIRLTATILFGFGTTFWLHAAYGNSWYFAHVVTTLFTLLALDELFKDAPRGWRIGLWVGCAALSRYTLVLAVPFFALGLWRRTGSTRELARFALALASTLAVDGLYNYVRFGNPFETGYALAEIQRQHPQFDPAKGLFHWSYFPTNFTTYFLRPPTWLGHFPWLEPSQIGMSILIVTPAFVYAVRAPRSHWLTWPSWATVILLMLPSLFYFAVGWKEFGWRYSLDFTPWLILLVALGFRGRLDAAKLTLVALSVLVNLWGLVYWRAMEWCLNG